MRILKRLLCRAFGCRFERLSQELTVTWFGLPGVVTKEVCRRCGRRSDYFTSDEINFSIKKGPGLNGNKS